MSLLKRSFFLPFLLILGCSAQSGGPTSAETKRRIELRVRSHYNVPPMVTIAVGERKPSEFNGYDLIPVTLSANSRSTTHEFLVSKDGTTLLNMTKFDLTTDPAANLDGRPFLGGKDAKVVIVNYDDFQCPFCARMHATLAGPIAKAYGDRVKIVYKDFPLESIHPWAVRAAVNARCLGAQSPAAYWEYLDFAHGKQREISAGENVQPGSVLDKTARDTGARHNVDAARLEACLKAQDETKVRADMAEGEKLGVESTPTLFVGAQKISGAIPENDLRDLLDRELKAAGVPVPERPAAKPTASEAQKPTPKPGAPGDAQKPAAKPAAPPVKK